MLICPTAKRIYLTEGLAEEALIDAHSRNNYAGSGPIAVYQCEDCGYYHFTSKGKMNEKLARSWLVVKSNCNKKPTGGRRN